MIIPTMVILASIFLATTVAVPNPNCPTECGGITIPYPFGIDSGSDATCYREGFNITCDDTSDTPKLHIGEWGYDRPISNLSSAIEQHELSVYTPMANNCLPQYPSQLEQYVQLGRPFVLSDRNKFTSIGCNTFSFFIAANDSSDSLAANNSTDSIPLTGCMSFCTDNRTVTEGLCDSNGCCQTPIRHNLTQYYLVILNVSIQYDYNPCSYAFLADEGWLSFRAADLSLEFGELHDYGAPVVLEWAIRDENSCQDAKANESSYACVSTNSFCADAVNGFGYICKCSEGYAGNPYLADGCQDLNECELPKLYPCYGDCINIEGSYKCGCKAGSKGNATIEGGCNSVFPLGAKIAVGIADGIMIMVVITSFIMVSCLKKKHQKEKDMFFKQNGGLILFEQLRSKQVDTIQIFTKDDLEKATFDFDDSAVIGCGGRGMVFRGILKDGRVVAIKKSKVFDEDQKEEFVNEMIILSEINHRNVVKLLGCCLEVDVPMLVYEFESNGSLYDNLHSKGSASHLKLGTRLRIASESAEALAYMHSSISRTIVHGDVKSMNILLNEKFTAKVSDFGASQLVPLDETAFLQFMQGTRGYLDPECLLTHSLTDKSDVYSFGVVLVELITSKMAIYTDEYTGQKKMLHSVFTEKMKEHKLRDILDEQLLETGDEVELIQEVAELAMQCLSVTGEERPMMRDVAEKIHSLINKCRQHSWFQQDFYEHRIIDEKEESLLLESRNNNFSNTDTNVFNSVQIGIPLNTEDGR